MEILSLVLAFSFISRYCIGIPQNVTIDDEFGDLTTGATPQYSPPGHFQHGSVCTSCHVHLDPAKTVSRTWRDATWIVGTDPLTISASFTGTAVYVFFILANQLNFTSTLTNVTFILDNDDTGIKSFVHEPLNTTDFNYSVPVYVNEGLDNIQHSILISTAGTSETGDLLVLFDNMVYTKDEDSVSITTSLSENSPTSTVTPSSGNSLTSTVTPTIISPRKHTSVVGPVIGGTAFLLALLITGFLYIRRRKNKLRPVNQDVTERTDILSGVMVNHNVLEPGDGHSLNRNAVTDNNGQISPFLYRRGITHENSAGELLVDKGERRDQGHEQGLTRRLALLEAEIDRLNSHVGRLEAQDQETLPGYAI